MNSKISIPDSIPEYKFFEVAKERKIAYLEYGEQNLETVFCVHGLTRNSSDYHFLAKILENDYRIICIDIAGRGASDHLSNPKNYSYHQYIEDILKFLEFKNIKKLNWIGTSMGGVLGILVAAEKKDLISRLILNDSGAFFPMETTEAIYRYLSKIPGKFETLDEISKKIRMTFSIFGIKHDYEWDFFIAHSIIQNHDGTYIMNYDQQIIEGFDKEDEFNKTFRTNNGIFDIWKTVEAKTLLIWGKLSSMLRIETIKKMERYKNISRISVKNAGHTPHLMNKALNELIFDWLKDKNIGNPEISL
jgi:pimeloyl-ACP methyl ester carboxylesterase